ncbi:MAG: PP2C family protein-serine/threonine phosphatase [Acidobacteriota bacterium]|nr:MAG: PP2C family protein-serine/threonine phosphatase [Acidobacteriota bacterium]
MNIKAKLFAVFAAIALMLCVNIGVHFWSVGQRRVAFTKLDKALQREDLLRQAEHNLQNQVKEIALLGEMSLTASGESLGESPIERLDYQDKLSGLADQLISLSEGESAARAFALQGDIATLSTAWAQFYQHIYSDPVQAIAVLALEAEPLSERLSEQFLPAWKEHETQTVGEAKQKTEAVNRMTGRMATAAFIATAILVVGVAVFSFRAQDDLSRKTQALLAAEKTAAHQKAELETAEHIQMVMLPASVTIPGYDLSAMMKPASEVGGDFFDFHKDPHNKTWISIGDVTGHGLTSGLVMMITQTVFETVVGMSKNGNSPKDTILTLNRMLYGYIHQRLNIDKHITAMILREEGDGNFTYSGSHEEILIYRNASQTVERIETPGGWLGVFHDIGYCTRERTFRLNKGDILLLYTDGITEARNAEGRVFGLDNLSSNLKRNRDLPAERIIAGLMETVDSWAEEQHDDRTCIVMKKEESSL